MLVTRVLDEYRRWLPRKARHIAVTGDDADTEWSFLPAENAMFHVKRSGMRKDWRRCRKLTQLSSTEDHSSEWVGDEYPDAHSRNRMGRRAC